MKKQMEEGWGARVVDSISKDLQDAFPEMKGFSARNIKYMRKFAENWPDFEFVQQVVAQIPWRSNILLLEKINRDFLLEFGQGFAFAGRQVHFPDDLKSSLPTVEEIEKELES